MSVPRSVSGALRSEWCVRAEGRERIGGGGGRWAPAPLTLPAVPASPDPMGMPSYFPQAGLLPVEEPRCCLCNLSRISVYCTF